MLALKHYAVMPFNQKVNLEAREPHRQLNGQKTTITLEKQGLRLL